MEAQPPRLNSHSQCPDSSDRRPVPLVSIYDFGANTGIATGGMSDWATEEHETTLVDVPKGKDVVDSCGDGREATKESAERIAEVLGPDTMSMEEGFASIFGGPVGKAICFLTVGIAEADSREEKQQFIADTGGINGVLDMIREARGGRSVLHSDIGKEGNRLHFDLAPGKPNAEVGCLYNGSLGHVLEAMATNDDVRRTIMLDLQRAFGDDGDKDAQKLLSAFKFLFDEQPAGNGLTFGRPDYEQQVKDRTLVAILEGEHPTVLKSGLLLNFDLDRVGSPTKAHELGLDPYRSDLGRIALGVGSILVERKVPTKLFLKAAVMLAVAVRGALVSVDPNTKLQGKVDPAYLPLGIIGDANLAAQQIDDRLGRRRDKNGVILL